MENEDGAHEVTELLHAGIAAAKAGQHAPARALLRRVTELAPDNSLGWLWLSGLVDDLDERIACLEHVLMLDPENAPVKQALEQLRPQRMDTWLRHGIADAEMGRNTRACERLMKVLEYDEENILAWFWLGKVVESSEEQAICFENVLTLDPEHTEAQEALAEIRRKRESRKPYTSLASELLDDAFAERDLIAEITPDVVETQDFASLSEGKPGRAPVSAASVILEDRFTELYGEPEAEPPPPPPKDIFDDIYLCPYCAAPTRREDRVCRACGNPLWRKKRRRVKEDRSNRFQLLAIIAGAMILLNVALLWFWLVFAGMRADISAAEALPLYLGSAEVAESIQATAFQALPPWVFWLYLIPLLTAIAILVGMYFHRPVVFFSLQSFSLLNVLVVLSLVIFIFVRGGEAFQQEIPEDIEAAERVALATQQMLSLGVNVVILVASIINVPAALAVLLLLRSLVDEYLFDEERMLLQVDKDVRSSDVGLRTRGIFYYRQRMWALAALHLRRATAINYSDPGLFLSLAATYINLKHYELAADAIAQARQLAPDMVEVQEMADLLREHVTDNERPYDIRNDKGTSS
jgi:tetratricopeptide (TPR) repeat protein